MTGDVLFDADLFFVRGLHLLAAFGIIEKLLLEVEFGGAELAVKFCGGEAKEGLFVGDAEGEEAAEAEDAGAGFFVPSLSVAGEVLGTGDALDIVEEVGGEELEVGATVAIALLCVPEEEGVYYGSWVLEKVFQESFVEGFSLFLLGLTGFGDGLVDGVGGGLFLHAENGEAYGAKAGIEVAIVGGGDLAPVDGGEYVEGICDPGFFIVWETWHALSVRTFVG